MSDNEYIDLYAEDTFEDENLLQNDNATDHLNLYDDVVFNSPTEIAENNFKIPEEANNQTAIKDPSTNFDINCPSNVGESKCEPTRTALIDENKKSEEIKWTTPDNIPKESRDPNIVKATYQLYVGNLAWWTSKEEIINVIKKIEITDLQELKLFVNKTNGCSKGYCLVSVGSQDSMRLCMEVLPNHKIDSRRPAVMVATKHAMNTFEKQYYTNSNLDNYCITFRSGSYSSQIPLPNLKVPPPEYTSHQSRPNCNIPQAGLHESQGEHYRSRSSVDEHRTNDQELEDMMTKIKTLTRLAISRARTDAKEKNYKSVEDTLNKAISLIRESKVFYDVRCKLLITSLDDELQNIMRNNRSRSRSRSDRMSRREEDYRYRKRSLERSGQRNRERSRERSRDRANRHTRRTDYREYESRDSRRRR